MDDYKNVVSFICEEINREHNITGYRILLRLRGPESKSKYLYEKYQKEGTSSCYVLIDQIGKKYKSFLFEKAIRKSDSILTQYNDENLKQFLELI
jgi:hypothetical protein